MRSKKKSNENYVTVFEANQYDKIPVLDKPFSQGGVLKLLSLQEFEARFGAKYSEKVMAPNQALTELKKACKRVVPRNVVHDDLLMKLKEKHSNPMNKLAIYFIDESVGYGVIATSDIKEGTVLCAFSGTLMLKLGTGDIFQNNDYSLAFFRSNTSSISICVEESRGLATFFQHLPDPETKNSFIGKDMESAKGNDPNFRNDIKELNSFEFIPGVKHLLATTNVGIMPVHINGLWLPFAVATRHIKKGEPLGYSYGNDYWHAREKYPLLFQRDGTLFPTTWYKRTSVDLAVLKENERVYLEISTDYFSYIMKCHLSLVGEFLPTTVNTAAGVLSTYFMREMLAAANAKEAENYAHLPLSSFALALLILLTKKVDKQIEVFVYWQNPFLTCHDENYGVVDVVCRAKSPKTFNLMNRFFKEHKKTIAVKEVPKTREIIIHGTNETERLSDLNQFIQCS